MPFQKAICEGKLKGLEGTQPILPPMPRQNYKKLKDEDIKAIFTYLKTTRPVKNIMPQPICLKAIQSKRDTESLKGALDDKYNGKRCSG